jgi:hypothetical protein
VCLITADREDSAIAAQGDGGRQPGCRHRAEHPGCYGCAPGCCDRPSGEERVLVVRKVVWDQLAPAHQVGERAEITVMSAASTPMSVPMAIPLSGRTGGR